MCSPLKCLTCTICVQYHSECPKQNVFPFQPPAGSLLKIWVGKVGTEIQALIKKYFVFPLPTLDFWVGWSVGKMFYFFQALSLKKVDPTKQLVCTCL